MTVTEKRKVMVMGMGIGGVQVISLHYDPIGVDNRSSGAKLSNNLKYKRNYYY